MLIEKKAFDALYDALFCTSDHNMHQADVGYLITLATITGYLSHHMNPALLAYLNEMSQGALKLRTPYTRQYKRFLSYLQTKHPVVKREGNLTLLNIQPRVGFFPGEV